MKKTIFIIILMIGAISINAQTNATLKSPGRLFATRDDLTSVILIIPADSTVSVLDSDSTYLHVVFQDNEGYIFNRRVVMNKASVKVQQASPSREKVRESQVTTEQQDTRFSYLENKYGTNMAARLISGKIWKGMNSDMVKDSWGTAEKINRVISGNVVKEEWIFRNTWLYFENNTLVEWGPIKNK
jgi:hypothetical protein